MTLGAVIGIVVLLGVIGAIAGDPDAEGGDPEDEPPVTSERPRTETTPADLPASSVTAARPAETRADDERDPSGVPTGGVGAALGLGDGARARVLSVTANAAPLDDFFAPDPGTTLTRLDVEQCAGSEHLNVNPFSWSVVLDDGSTAELTFSGGGLQVLGLAPGACTRGLFDMAVPDGRSASTVVLADALLDALARWDLAAPAVPIDGPLTATEPITPSALATPASGPDVGSAVVHGVEPDASPVDDFLGPSEGFTFTRLDVELCAGAGPLLVNPFFWFGRQDDGITVGVAFTSQGLDVGEVAAGQCVQGTVDLEVAEGRRVEEVIWVDAGLDELARWAVT